MRLRIRSEAEDEVQDATRYLERQKTGLSLRFLTDLDETLERIIADPLAFPAPETIPDETPYRRARLNLFKYVVVYDVRGDEIVVVAVAHTSRMPNYWLDRLR